MKAKQIGTISNYYGGLFIKKMQGKYYWTIENWNRNPEESNDPSDGWEEISKELYKELKKHNYENIH